MSVCVLMRKKESIENAFFFFFYLLRYVFIFWKRDKEGGVYVGVVMGKN